MSFRKAFEQGFAGVIFCGTVVLILGATLAACFPGAAAVFA